VSDAKWWLVCYDVRDDKRLRKCAKHMEGYGHRIQYSVFRCWMTTAEMERLRWELTTKLAAEDEVLLMPLCGRCAGGVWTVSWASTRRTARQSGLTSRPGTRSSNPFKRPRPSAPAASPVERNPCPRQGYSSLTTDDDA
jgi:CRISPR-associated protein Cas2